MKYNQPFDQPSSPNAPYVDGNPSAGIQGSIVPAAAIEMDQREIVNFITDTGLSAPDNADLHQLARAVQAGRVNYGIDQGIPGQMAIILVPQLLSYFDGLRVFVKSANANPGDSTLQVGSLGQRQVVRRDGSILKRGDILPNAIQEYAFEGTSGKWQLMSTGFGGQTVLTANLVLYVNWATGLDTNDGTLPVLNPLISPLAGPLKTIQKAIDIAFSYPPSQYTVTVFIADNTNYQGFGTPPWVGPNLNIIGNTTTPANVRINGGESHCCVVNGVNTMNVTGVRVQTNYPATNLCCGFVSTNSAIMHVTNCENGQIWGGVFEAFAASLGVGNHKFDGDCHEFYWAMLGGYLSIEDGAVHTIAKPISVTNATCYAASVGCFAISGGPTYVNPSNVTGKKYYATINGTITTTGKPVTYFPGTIAGTVDYGGQYL